jgi:hypothetical protein
MKRIIVSDGKVLAALLVSVTLCTVFMSMLNYFS